MKSVERLASLARSVSKALARVRIILEAVFEAEYRPNASTASTASESQAQGVEKFRPGGATASKRKAMWAPQRTNGSLS
eukprot:scaffold208231_cov51-Prasinocladus_malaysianus.AAC.1